MKHSVSFSHKVPKIYCVQLLMKQSVSFSRAIADEAAYYSSNHEIAKIYLMQLLISSLL